MHHPIIGFFLIYGILGLIILWTVAFNTDLIDMIEEKQVKPLQYAYLAVIFGPFFWAVAIICSLIFGGTKLFHSLGKVDFPPKRKDK